ASAREAMGVRASFTSARVFNVVWFQSVITSALAGAIERKTASMDSVRIARCMVTPSFAAGGETKRQLVLRVPHQGPIAALYPPPVSKTYPAWSGCRLA